MKKLLLLLLCVPLMFSCGEKTEEGQEVEEKSIEKMKYSTSLTFFVKYDDLDDKELYGFIDIYTKKT